MTEFANPGAALGQGLNTGANFASKVIGNSRDRQQYQQDQSARQGAADDINNIATTVPGQEPGTEADQNAAAHSNFLQSLGQGLSHIGTGINNFFAGAPPAGAKGSAAALPPQAGVAPAPGGAPGAVALPAGPNPQAAPVGLPQAPGAPTMGVAGGAPAYMSGGGIVPQPGGALDPKTAFLEGGGTVDTPGAALGAGLNQGANFAGTVIGNARQTEQYNQDQAARQAEVHPIEQFAAHLHGGALDDQGTPNNAPQTNVGLPDPTAATAAAQKGANPAQSMAVGLTAQVAKDPAAQQGKPESASTQAHSLTSDWWDQNDKLMLHAASAAAAAGHDPDQVYQSLNHMRTSFVQGHMLRAASAASVALQNGDMKAVEQNLRNMNYYLPDGKDLNVQKDANGNLMYQSPLQQYVDSQGNPTDNPKGADGKPNRPNMIPVDQAHIQMLGQAILDPMKVNDTLMATRSAVAKQKLEAAQTQAQVNDSSAKLLDAQTKAKRLGSQSVLDLSHAEYFRARASAAQYAISGLKNQKLDPTVLHGSQAAANYVMDALLGPKKQVNDVDDTGQPNMSPAAGKVIHDSSKIDPQLQGATATDQAHMAATAANLYAANAKGGMSAAMAGDLALQVFGARNKTHPGPDGKPQPNAYTHEETGEVGIWDPKQKMYRKYNILPGAADAIHGSEQANSNYLKLLTGATAPEENGESDTSADDNAPAQ